MKLTIDEQSEEIRHFITGWMRTHKVALSAVQVSALQETVGYYINHKLLIKSPAEVFKYTKHHTETINISDAERAHHESIKVLKEIQDTVTQPAVLYKPEITQLQMRVGDENTLGWRALYYDVIAIGRSPEEAIHRFNILFKTGRRTWE